jgi:LacI family transcriptional regulator
VVWIDHYDATIACDKVVTENQIGAFMAVNHLITAGHKNIGFLGDVQHSPCYVERWQGYQTALERGGLKPEPAWQWTDAEEQPDKIAAYWEGLSERPSAWFCANDILAVHLLRVVQERGFSVPAEVAVVGFDDLRLAQTSVPQVTTVHVGAEYYAARAVEMLADRLEHPDRPPEVVRITPSLVVRGSTRRGEMDPVEEVQTRI